MWAYVFEEVGGIVEVLVFDPRAVGRRGRVWNSGWLRLIPRTAGAARRASARRLQRDPRHTGADRDFRVRLDLPSDALAELGLELQAVPVVLPLVHKNQLSIPHRTLHPILRDISVERRRN